MEEIISFNTLDETELLEFQDFVAQSVNITIAVVKTEKIVFTRFTNANGEVMEL